MFFVTGDLHGDIDMGKLNSRSWPEQKKLTRDDYLIVCGDFGAVWYGDRKDNYMLKWHEDKTYTTLFVDGNHENFDSLDQYPVCIWNGGKVHMIRPHVIHLMRGQIYDIDGRTIFTFGGGMSSDRKYRKEGVSWWPREQPSEAEMEEARKNLDAYDNRIDYIITHAAPRQVLWNDLSCYRASLKLDCSCETFLDEIMGRVLYQRWFCGHYHIDCDVPHARLQALYYGIHRI